jgi:hypothetical protein
MAEIPEYPAISKSLEVNKLSSFFKGKIFGVSVANCQFEEKGPPGLHGHKYVGWFNLGFTLMGHMLHVPWVGIMFTCAPLSSLILIQPLEAR